MAFAFFTDAALTTPLSSAVVFVQDVAAPAPQDRVIWLGATDAAKTLFDAADPGGTPITVSVQDAASGSGMPASAVKLAASSFGLDAAVAGAPLSLGLSISGGVAGAREIHIRVNWSSTTGVFTDVSLVTSEVIG